MLSLAAAITYAAVQAATSVLPLSPRAHRLAVAIWLAGERHADAVVQVAELGCFLAILLVVRRRLLRAMADGLRGLARPALLRGDGGMDAVALALASLVAGCVEIALQRYASALNQVPLLTVAGLLLTAAALVSTWLAPPPSRVTPGPGGALLAGLAFGLAVVPGASPVAGAFVLLRWFGVGAWRAAEWTLMLSLPLLLLRIARALLDGRFQTLAPGRVALVVLVAFLAATLAAKAWRALCERTASGWLALWLALLGLAILGYQRALPDQENSRRFPQLQSSRMAGA